MLTLVSFLLLIYSFFLIRTALPKLPSRMPTHFDAAGVANGWGSPDTLWIIFVAQALTCAVFLIVPFLGQRYPNSIHVGLRRLSDFPAPQRAKVLRTVNQLVAGTSIVMNLFMVVILHGIIQAAELPVPHFRMLWAVVLGVGAILAVFWFYLGKIRRIVNLGGPGATRTRE